MTGLTQVAPGGNPDSPLRFGVFELDLSQAELRRGGVKVKLQDQPLQILEMLLERPGQIVTRDELRARLWPTDFVDFDHSLNTAIRKLRVALDDTAENPRYIETVARRGYRFIAPVTAPADTPTSSPTIVRSRKAQIAGIATLVLLIAAAVVLSVYRGKTGARQINAVAVLPFTNNDASTEHISDGLAEVLIDTLSRAPDLRVAARTSVFHYKGRKVDPWQVGEDLNVGAVVIGDVRRTTDGYSVRVELLDARDATQMWGQRFNAPATQLPSLQSRISGELAQVLRQRIDVERRRQITRPYTTNPAAYDEYLRGLQTWNQRKFRNQEALTRAIAHFRRAIEIDPSFAAAYAGLANTYGVMIGNGMLRPEEGTPLVTAAANKALELDPTNAEAYTSIASTQYRNSWDFEAAGRNYRRALEMNPNYATGHQWYADYLRTFGQLEEARKEIETAYRLDPLSPAINATMCWAYNIDRQYEEAIAFSRRVAAADPALRAPFCETAALLALNRDAELIALMEKHGGVPHLVDGFRTGGREGYWRARREFIIKTRPVLNLPFDVAETYAAVGRKDEAFEWLEKAFQLRASRLTSIATDGSFDPIRDDPRYADLLRRIGIPDVRVPAPKETPAGR